MRKPVLLATAASVFLAMLAHAQKKTEPTTNSDSVFSSDTRLVLIDSIVTNRKGADIGDLTRENFKVREDGKEQTIASFSDGTPDVQKHYLVLLFDDSTVPVIDQHYARDAAMKFIGSNAGPNRLMSVVEFGGRLRVAQNLTNDVDRLKQAVDGVKPSDISAGTRGVIGPVGRANAQPQPGGLPEALSNLAGGLVKLPGRKTVVLFSEGLSANSDRMKAVIEECNRANAAVYPVDIGVLARKGSGGAVTAGDASFGRALVNPPVPQNPAVTRQTSEADLNALDNLSAPRFAPELLYNLARGTGGFVVSSPDKLADDLNRIGTEESRHYVLGYLPAKDLKPGACHTIKVDVDRSGASVRARTSYCDVETPEIRTGPVAERDLEARLNSEEAAGNGGAAPTVHATMQTPFFYVAPNIARVDLALDIPGAALKFVNDKGKFTATLNVIGIAYLPDNGVAARFNETRKITLDDRRQVDEFASRPWHFEKQFEMASGNFDLKVAFGSGAASFGSVETNLIIDPWDPSKFLLSGLALSQSTHPVSPARLGDVDLSGDDVPLTVSGVQFIPAGTNRLLKQEKAYIYGEICGPSLAIPGLVAQLTVLDAKTGNPVKSLAYTPLKTETLPGTSNVPFDIALPIDDLPPGSYTAQIIAQDAAGNRSMRTIDFDLD